MENSAFDVLAADHLSEDDDIFQCGRCKMQFTSLTSFSAHKHNHFKRDKDAGICRSTKLQENLSVTNNMDSQQETSTDNQDKFSCEVFSTTSSAVHQSLNDGEFFSIALGTSHVYALQNDNLHISEVGDEKVIENADIYSSSSSLEMVQPTTDQKVGEPDANPSSELSTSKQSVVSNSHDLFHERMTKSSLTNSGNLRTSTKHYCTFCQKEFTKNFDLQQHLRSHTGEKPFQCIVCGRAFAQKSNAKKHMSTHRVWPDSTDRSTKTVAESNEKDLQRNGKNCSFCDKIFGSYMERTSHMKNHYDQKVYICIQKDCKKTFTELENFLVHVRTHDRPLEYPCHVCAEVFSSLSSLGYHQLEHSLCPCPKQGINKLDKFRQCSECSLKFCNADALNHHLNLSSHHHPCTRCSKICKSEKLLRNHSKIHDIQSLQCQVCSKFLKGSSSLKIHQIIHTDARPFECELCHMTFNRRDRLKRHKLVHVDKKLKCPLNKIFGCDMEFRRNDKLRLHLATHFKRFTRAKGQKRVVKRRNGRRYMKTSKNDFKGKAKDLLRCKKANKFEVKTNAQEVEVENGKPVVACIFITDNTDEPLRRRQIVEKLPVSKPVKVNAENKTRPLLKNPLKNIIPSCRLKDVKETSPKIMVTSNSDQTKAKDIQNSEVVTEAIQVTESDYIVSYPTEDDTLISELNKDVEVIYFPFFSSDLLETNIDNKGEDMQCVLEIQNPSCVSSNAVTSKTHQDYLDSVNHTIIVSESIFEESQNELPLR